MTFRFYRRFRIAPRVRINLAKRSSSVTFGPRGLHLTLGSRGARVGASIPGTGLSEYHTFNATRSHAATASTARPGSGTGLWLLLLVLLLVPVAWLSRR